MNNLRTSLVGLVTRPVCRTGKFLQKPPSPYFFMVHLLHRLYGVDAPECCLSFLSY